MASNDVMMVYPAALWPVAGGGARRALDLMAFLRRNGLRVTVVTIDHGEARPALASLCDALHTAPPQTDGAALAKHALRAVPGASAARALWQRFISPSGGGLAALRNPAIEGLAVETARTLRPAAVIAHFASTAYCLDAMPPGTLKIVDTHDVQHQRQAAAKAAGGRLDRPECTRDEEASALNHADMLLAITPGEAATLHAMCPGVRVLLVSHAVSTGEYIPSPDASREILFVANLYDPNVRGLQRFFDESWPAIRAACPEATLTVCGRVGEAFRLLPAGVRAEGVVQSLDEYYSRAALVINPVLYGTGQAIKTLEALARGRALVCAPDGLRGLEHTGDVPCRVARHGTAMTASVLDLLKGTAKRHALERRAIEFAASKFAPAAVYGPLLTALRTMKPGPAGAPEQHS